MAGSPKSQGVGDARIRYDVLRVEETVEDDAIDEDEDVLVMAGLDVDLVDDAVELKLLDEVLDVLVLPAAL